MEGNRPAGKRIALSRTPATPAIIDEMGFTANKSSLNARKVFSVVESFKIEGWFDKHYHNRHQHGDDKGKREGIDPNIVQDLVRRSIKFLVQFSATVKGFKFINHLDSTEKGLRIVVREEYEESMLNLVLQSHYIDATNFEITVITAMKIDGFKIADGQYVVELQENGADLYKLDNSRFRKILSL